MANTNAPFGCKTVGAISGLGAKKLKRYYCPSTEADAIFIGDVVVVTGGAHTDAEGTPIIHQGAGSDCPRGILEGVEYLDDLNINYRKASTGMYCLVNEDPGVIFEMQEDADGTLVAADAGKNINYTATDGSTSTGTSAFVLDSNTAATTPTLPIRLLRLSPRMNNAAGQYAVWECMFNIHDFKSNTGVTGV